MVRKTRKRPARKRPAKKRSVKPTKKRTRKTPKTLPVKRGRGRPLKGQELQWVEPFLDALTRTFYIKKTCELVGCSYSTVRDRRAKDSDFDAKVKEAQWEAVQYADFVTFDHGVNGYLEPVFYKGEHVNEIRKWDTTSRLAFLNAHYPELYHHRVDMKAKVETTPRIDLSDLQNATNEEAMAAYRESLLQPSEN